MFSLCDYENWGMYKWMYEPSMMDEFFPIPYSCPNMRWGLWVVLVWIFVSMILTNWAIKARMANSCDVCDHEFQLLWTLSAHKLKSERHVFESPSCHRRVCFGILMSVFPILGFETHYFLYSLFSLRKATRHYFKTCAPLDNKQQPS